MPALTEPTSPVASKNHGPARVELILSQLDKLPAPSAVVAKLLALTLSSDSSASDLIEILQTDAAIAAGVLRAVNRADLGARAPKMTLQKAVTLLGLRHLRNAIISQQFFDIFKEDAASNRELRNQLWKHNLAVACTSEALAENQSNKLSRIDPGEAFVAGLLHDIGKLALLACLPKGYARVEEKLRTMGGDVCDVEQAVLGLDHTVVGRRLASRWRLSPAIVESAWLHHQAPAMLPASSKNPEVIRLVQLANALMQRAGYGTTDIPSHHDIDELSRLVGLDPTGLPRIIEAAIEKLRPLCESVGIDVQIDPAEQLRRLSEANGELGRLNAQLMSAHRQSEGRLRALEVIATFVDEIGIDAEVGGVCAAAANAMRHVSGAVRAIGFAKRSGTGEMFVCGTDVKCDLVADQIAEADHQDSGTLEQAPPWAVNLFERTVQSTPTEALWLFRFSAENAIGGVILEADSPSRASQDNPREFQFLAQLMGQSVSAALNRAQAERLSEDLLDINRRMHAAQKDSLRVRSLAMIGEMAAGAAHEVNNPLSVISGRAQMMLADASDDQSRRGLETIVEQAQRASAIVSELMRFAKPEPPKPKAIRLATALESICQHWCSQTQTPPASLSLDIADPQAAIFADEDHVREILEALLTNAHEASKPEEMRIEINSASPQSDERVRIAVTDRGRGMSPEAIERAFDPFYSNRPAGRGRGLGLSRAYRLAEINGGRLWIESQRSQGTTVTFELPARSPTSASPA